MRGVHHRKGHQGNLLTLHREPQAVFNLYGPLSDVNDDLESEWRNSLLRNNLEKREKSVMGIRACILNCYKIPVYIYLHICCLLSKTNSVIICVLVEHNRVAKIAGLKDRLSKTMLKLLMREHKSLKI